MDEQDLVLVLGNMSHLLPQWTDFCLKELTFHQHLPLDYWLLSGG